MKSSPFSPDKFMLELYDELYREPYGDVKNADGVFAASREIRRRAEGLFALERIPKDPQYLQAQELGKRLDYPDYTLQKYSVRLCKDLPMAVFLLEPKNLRGKAPGVVALCGHGYGVRQILNITKKGGRKTFRYLDGYQKNFAVELAKRGCVVAAPELFGFGEARLKKDLPKPFYASSCRELSLHLLTCGLTTASLRVFEAISCVELLSRHGGVDAQRLGIMGISGGGLAALYASVLDERIKRTVVSGYINSFRDSILSLRHCPDNYIPGILEIGEMSDFACALAPRELLVESGTRDRLFPIEASRKAHDKLTRIYALAGASEKLHIDVFNGRHRVSGRKAFDFLAG